MLVYVHAHNNTTTILYNSPYFRPRTGTLEGIAVSAFVGVVSGYYIFNPLLQEMAANRAERERLEALESQQGQQGGGGGSQGGQEKQQPKQAQQNVKQK